MKAFKRLVKLGYRKEEEAETLHELIAFKRKD